MAESESHSLVVVDQATLLFNWAEANQNVCWVPGSENDRVLRQQSKLIEKVQEAVGKTDPGAIAISQIPNLPSVALDVKTLYVLLKDFGFTGTFRTAAKGGRSYVIFKGHSGARTMFTGTRYLVSNPQVVKLAIGKAGVNAMAVGSMKVNFISFVPFFIVNELFFDTKDDLISELGVRFASGVSKIAVASAVGLLIAGGLTAGGIVVAGAGTVFLVAVGVGLALEAVDNYFGITKAMEEYARDLQLKFEKKSTEVYVDFEREFLNWVQRETGVCIPVYSRCF